MTENARLSWEAIVARRGGIITHVPLLRFDIPPQTEFYTYDIHCSVMFFEIPVHLKIGVPITHQSSVFLLSGICLSSARKDYSSLRNKKVFHGTEAEYWDEQHKAAEFLNYDGGLYFPIQLDKSLRLGYNWGIGFSYDRFTVETRYSTLYQDIGHLSNIYRVDLRTFSIQIILNVHLFN